MMGLEFSPWFKSLPLWGKIGVVLSFLAAVSFGIGLEVVKLQCLWKVWNLP